MKAEDPHVKSSGSNTVAAVALNGYLNFERRMVELEGDVPAVATTLERLYFGIVWPLAEWRWYELWRIGRHDCLRDR